MILSGVCTATTCVVILASMVKHSLRFSNPNEQLKYVKLLEAFEHQEPSQILTDVSYRIMRIATLLPLYSIFSFIPICFPNTYVYMFGWIEVVQGIALYSFLMLLCDFLAPNDRHRVFFFASLRIPGRRDKTKTTDGLTWLQVRHSYLCNSTPRRLLN